MWQKCLFCFFFQIYGFPSPKNMWMTELHQKGEYFLQYFKANIKGHALHVHERQDFTCCPLPKRHVVMVLYSLMDGGGAIT